MPLPTDTLFRVLPSPVPTQTTSGFGWKTATAPIDATGWSSKSGSHVRPPLTDFQTPPEAAPTYTTSGSDSTAAIAATRPLIPAGPIDRAFIPAKRSGSTAAHDAEATNSRARKKNFRTMISPKELRRPGAPRGQTESRGPAGTVRSYTQGENGGC